MKRHIPLYVVAAAVLILVSVAFGLPASTLFLVGFVLLCPLMMMFMMGGMHGGHRNETESSNGRDSDDLEHHDRKPSARS